MRGRSITILLQFLFLQFSAFAQEVIDNEEFIQAVMSLKGISSEEYLSDEEVENYRRLMNNPLDINYSSRAAKSSPGLFTPYQLAVLEDYRSRCGNIVSFTELAALDGFGEAFVRRIVPFIIINDFSVGAESRAARHELVVRGGGKADFEDESVAPEGQYGLKYAFSSSQVEAGVALRSGWEPPYLPPADRTFFVSIANRSRTFKTVIGDFNAKFGQGLALWSGFSMSGGGAPAAFSKNPRGITPYRSYSGEGTFRGVSASYSKGAFSATAFVAGEGLRELYTDYIKGKDYGISLVPGLNIGWYGFREQASVTCVARSPEFAVFSADGRYSFNGVDVFGELACSLTPNDMHVNTPEAAGGGAGSAAGTNIKTAVAALGGARFPAGPNAEAAVMARYYPAAYESDFSGAMRSSSKCSNEHAISASFRHLSEQRITLAGRTGFGSSVNRSDFSANVDCAYSPEPKYGVDTSSLSLEAELSENLILSPRFSLKGKFKFRYRTYSWPFKISSRLELEYHDGPWMSKLRLDALKCRAVSGAGYCEAGYKDGRLSCYFRAGAFIVDYWDDRIYIYERTAPGNFSVPAYYGRGYWLALVSSVKLNKSLKLHFRAAYTAYPWLRPGQSVPKPARLDIAVQFQALF